jgi:transcriptional regulator with XRE-family HTH domain
MQGDLEIGERIRNIREGMRMSREIFSENINISEVFLGQIERGERLLSIKTLSNIVSYTGASSDFILFGETTNMTIKKKINRILDNSSEETVNFIYEIIRNTHSFIKQLNKLDEKKLR